MNKHEAIKKVEQMGEYERFVNELIPKLSVLNILNQLDEPQKPTVPQCVADWYEEHKDNLEYNIWDYVFMFKKKEETSFKKWFDDYKTKPFQTLVNMHQFGYKIEEEKRYLVKIIGIKDYYSYLNYRKEENSWTVESKMEVDTIRTSHTRKELEQAGFSWVFDCPGVEVEEVE